MNSVSEARDVDRTENVVEAAIPAALSNLGSRTQPEKGVNMATPQSSPVVAVLRPWILKSMKF